MEQRQLHVQVRTATGKNICRRLRAQGLVPGVVYGKGMDAVPVTVSPKELAAATSGEGGRNALLSLSCEGGLNGSLVIVADTYVGAIKGELRHVDLHKVNLAEKVHVDVEVKLIGTAAGVKEGGMLDFAMHRVAVECLPQQIPEHIDVDITSLTIGHSIHIGELKAPEGVKLLGDPKAAVVSILGKAREEAPAAE